MTDEKKILTPARIQIHLNNGYTKLLLATGGVPFDVPTSSIPEHLRAVGNRILVTFLPSDPRLEKNGEVTYSYKDYVISELPSELA